MTKALDTRRIIRYQRALKTLLALTLPKQSRILVQLQRSTSVIDPFKGEEFSSDDDVGSEFKALKKLQNQRLASDMVT